MWMEVDLFPFFSCPPISDHLKKQNFLSAPFHFLTFSLHIPLEAWGYFQRGVQESPIVSIPESLHHHGDTRSPSRHLHVGDEPSCCLNSGLLTGLEIVAGDLTGHLLPTAVSMEQGLSMGNLYQVHCERKMAQKFSWIENMGRRCGWGYWELGCPSGGIPEGLGHSGRSYLRPQR